MTGKLKIVAAVLLVAGSLFILTALLSQQAAPPVPVTDAVEQKPTGLPVVVARGTLPFGEPVQSEMLKIENVAERPDGTFADVNEVIGRIPVITVAQGQKLTKAAFEVSPLADQVRTGFRAIAIRIDDQTAGVGRLQPGDIVDVFSVFRRDDRDVNSTQSRQVLARLRVISVGPRVVGQPEPKDEQAASGGGGGQTMRNLTLEVPIADVNLLLLAQQQGNLMVALRNPEDSTVANREAFPEPSTLLKKKEPKDKKLTPEPLTPDERAYAGVAMDSVAVNTPARNNPASPTAAAAPRADGTGKIKKDTREEPQKVEMIRRGKSTNEVAQ